MAKKRKAEKDTPDSEEEETSSSSSSSSSEEEVSSSEENSSDDDDSSSSSEEEEETSSSSSKREKLRKLLEPFSKDQIVAFLKEEALKDPSILSRIVQRAESEPTHRKIFIHGLSWDATEEQVLQVFRPFGQIEEFKLITDKTTGRAKGYAFVLFKTRASAKKALKVPHKKIGDRTASCQLAALGPAAGSAAVSGLAAEVSKRKLFVANVGPNVNVERLRAFFGKFGEIEDGPLGLDPSTNKPRGFAIFVYKSVDGMEKALEEPVKLFEGCQLNCKKFVEGLNSSSNKRSSSSTNTQQNQSGLAAAMAGIGGNYGMNSLSPSMIGNYGLQAALQGLGVYQGAHMGQSSVGANAAGVGVGTGSAQAQPGDGSSGIALPSYFGH